MSKITDTHLFRNIMGFFRRYVNFGRSIYARVILIIAVLSILLFTSFGLIFKSVYEQYLNTVILQSANNVGSLVEGALYYSMLENDKSSLQNTLDIIHTMPGIEDVNMYDSQDNLAYSSFPADSTSSSYPNCKSCHKDVKSLFPGDTKSYKIISPKSECRMNANNTDQRHLIIRSPIKNSKSCYESSCHAHSASETTLGSLVIKVPLKELDEAVSKSSLEFYFLAILTTILLLVFLIFWTHKEIKQPLNQLIGASVAVANGDRNMRVKLSRNSLDDMSMVSNAFNNMLDNLQAAATELENWSQQLEYKVQKKTEELGAAQNELIHIERLASLGKLSSSVAHEINNPLAGILVYTKLVQKQLNHPDLTEEKREAMLRHLRLIEAETKRCGDIVKGLLDFSKKDQEDFEPRHLHELLEETFELMRHPVQIANISFLKELKAGNDLIYCSPNQVKQACIAILVNASEAVTENGEIIIRTSNPDPDNILLEIIDNGIGISPEDMPHIFEPFFSTKRETQGIGLGLAIVHGIMQSHHARIQVKSEPGQGTTILFTIPLISIQEKR